ncbi:unnamed protein product [Owenia fusiformis]|uniref:Coiled-coil domain-containing protein 9 n=1 Tax=Owenia fusiformis TaxID=6347 RepID=A0A8S4PAW5_OWEFU|nr:unnamed protein product [Owenia fusiformis]
MASRFHQDASAPSKELFLDILTKEEREAMLTQKMEQIRKKNDQLRKRHKEVQADKKHAEQSGTAVSPGQSVTETLSHREPKSPSEHMRGVTFEDPKPRQATGRGKQLAKMKKEKLKAHEMSEQRTPDSSERTRGGFSARKMEANKRRGENRGPRPLSDSYDEIRKKNAQMYEEEMKNEGGPPSVSMGFLNDPSREGPLGEHSKGDRGRRHPRNFGGNDPSGVKERMKQEREYRDSRGGGPPRNKMEMSLQMTGKERREYETWKAERDRVDQDRINRQQRGEGTWRREWDNEKKEEDYNFDSSVEPVRRPGFGGKFGDFMPGDDSHRGQGRSDGSRGRGDSLRPTHGDSPRNRGEPSRNYDGHRNRGDAYHDHRGDERSPRSFGDGPRGRGEGSRGRGDSSRGRGDGSRGRGLIRGARGASARGMRGGRLRPRGGTAGTGRTRAHSGGSTGSDEARHIQDDENTLVIRIDNEAGSARRKTNERGKPRSPRSPTSKQGKPRGKEGKDKKLRESRPLRSSTPTKEKHSEVTEGDSKPTNPDNVEEENAIKIDSDIQISINRASGEREIRSTSKDKEDVEEPRAGSSDSQSRGSSSEKDLREGSNEIRASNSGKESRGGSSEKENSDYGDQYEEYEEEHQDEWEDCDDDFYEEEVESLEEEPRQVLQLDVHTEDDSSMLPPTTPVMKTPTGVVHILDWAQAVEDNSFDASGSSVEASPREQRTPGDSPRNINKTEEIPLEIKNETPIESPKEQTSQNAGANESKVKIEENGKQNEVSEQNEQNKDPTDNTETTENTSS